MPQPPGYGVVGAVSARGDGGCVNVSTHPITILSRGVPLCGMMKLSPFPENLSGGSFI